MTDLARDARLAFLEQELRMMQADYEICASQSMKEARDTSYDIARLLARSPDADVYHLLLKFKGADAIYRECRAVALRLENLLHGKNTDD